MALVDNIFWNFGPPEKIISDRTQAFIGEVIKGVCKAMDIKHIRSSGYQPQGNAVERFHSFLNAALTIQCQAACTVGRSAGPDIVRLQSKRLASHRFLSILHGVWPGSALVDGFNAGRSAAIDFPVTVRASPGEQDGARV